MVGQQSIRIVLADPHPAFRWGLRSILSQEPELLVVHEAQEGPEALRATEELRPDVLLVEACLPGLSGQQVIENLSSKNLPVHGILVTGAIERAEVMRVLQSGARGVILKTAPPDTYAKAIRRVCSGELWVERQVLSDWALANARKSNHYGLTRRELEIVREILNGSSNKQMAVKFNISEPTIKAHLTNIFNKLGVSSRLELSAFALQNQLLR